MSLLVRKALWPAAIAASFLLFLGAIGQGNVVRTASADIGDVCLIESTATPNGDWIMTEGTTEDFTAFIEDLGNDPPEIDVDLDDITGDSDITSLYGNPVGPTDFLSEPDAITDSNVCGDTDEEVLADILDDVVEFLEAAIEDGENCWVGNDPPGTDGNDATDCQAANPDDDDPSETDSPGPPNDNGVNDNDIDCGYAVNAGGPCSISTSGMADAAEAIAEEIFDGNNNCDSLGLAGEAAYILAHPGGEFVGAQIHDFVQDNCTDLDKWFGEPWLDAEITVDVTCEDAGTFELSFAIEDGADEGGNGAGQTTVDCVGEVDDILITADPGKIEIVPAMGSVSYSLIVVRLVDADGNPVLPPEGVDFSTNRCVFLDEDGLTEEEFESVKAEFDDYDVNDADSAVELTEAVEAIDHDDADDVSNKVAAFIIDADAGNGNLSDIDNGDAIAAIILDCTAFSTVPGVATITAEVDQDGEDITKTTTVTVVGPPAAPIGVAKDADNVICGDRVQITVTVKDSAGQNVSDHTLVEAVTNFGGVLAGTGAVAGQLGFVVPVSSTLAETFNGVATFYLITSDTHVGGYNVTVATGGGGSVTQALGGFFSTPVQTGQVTVTCQMPAAPVAPVAPTVTAPRTGQGIVPPNTGDAGLAAASGNGLSLFVIAGIVAFALAGVATLRFARR